MEAQIINQEVLERLKQMQSDIDLLKKNLVDSDTILTSEEEEAVDQALEEYERGETISHEELKKELGL